MVAEKEIEAGCDLLRLREGADLIGGAGKERLFRLRLQKSEQKCRSSLSSQQCRSSSGGQKLEEKRGRYWPSLLSAGRGERVVSLSLRQAGRGERVVSLSLRQAGRGERVVSLSLREDVDGGWGSMMWGPGDLARVI
jgi:hypothetical protein